MRYSLMMKRVACASDDLKVPITESTLLASKARSLAHLPPALSLPLSSPLSFTDSLSPRLPVTCLQASLLVSQVPTLPNTAPSTTNYLFALSPVTAAKYNS